MVRSAPVVQSGCGGVYRRTLQAGWRRTPDGWPDNLATLPWGRVRFSRDCAATRVAPEVTDAARRGRFVGLQPGTAEHASHGAAFHPERAARTQGPMTIAVQTQSAKGPMRRMQCDAGCARARFHRSPPQPGGPFFEGLVFSPLPARALRDLESRPRNWRRAAYRSSGLNDEKNADRRDPRGRNPRGRAGW